MFFQQIKRVVFNQTWNAVYYFNCGSLDGDELLRQLINVIIACELVGIKLKLQMSDAGGVNMKTAVYLTNYKYNSLSLGKTELDCVIV